MNATDPAPEIHSAKGKRPLVGAAANASSGPTSFFMCSEKEMERRRRGHSRASDTNPLEEEDMAAIDTSSEHLQNSSFGVQSLEETISSAFGSGDSLSRPATRDTERSFEGEANISSFALRKSGNPVHPRIAATGQRIISGELASVSKPTSPVSMRAGRRGSTSSPFHQHLNRGSPYPVSAIASTPRSVSPKSIRLSDDDASIAEETGSQALHSSSEETESQAIQSSSGEDEDRQAPGQATSFMPQLVMPRVAMPVRRPFTEKGKLMGRLKTLVVGPDGVGKTSLIQSIVRTCEDIVHLDQSPGHSIIHSSTLSAIADENGRSRFVENFASTRPYPSWWTDLDSRRMILRRKSFGGEAVLDRNLCFIDSPGIAQDCGVDQVATFMDTTLRRMTNMQTMNDAELIHVLSGEGGLQVDAVLWLFRATSSREPSAVDLTDTQKQLLSILCQRTNVIPLLARTDGLDQHQITAQKQNISDFLKSFGVKTYTFETRDSANGFGDTTKQTPSEPFAVSSALEDDSETIDASILMSSQYIAPLVRTDLEHFIQKLLDPENIAKMRHLAATKYLLWRQQDLGPSINVEKMPSFGSPALTGQESALEEPSKVLVPHSSSSFYRSASPSGSDLSAMSGQVARTSTHALAKLNERTQTAEPYHQVRLAKWAQDLQRSLEHERERYKQWYFSPTTDWTSNDGEEGNNQALVTTKDAQRPAKGRLGGDVAIIDPRDPLGLLAFTQACGRRGKFALRIAGTFGLLGVFAYWASKNWNDLQEALGFGHPTIIHAPAVPAPPRSMFSWDAAAEWKNFFGWSR